MIYLTVTDAVDQITSVSESINEYGPYTVLLSVFIVIFLVLIIHSNNSQKKMIENIIKSNENYCDAIKKQNEELLEKIVENSDRERTYDEKDLASIFVKLNTTLKSECQKAQRNLRADCMCVYVLHNGMHSSHGLPFFKMSCICEWIKKGSGIHSRIREHSNLPINLFDQLMIGLFQNGEYFIDAKAVGSSNLSMFINGPRVVNCVCIPIYDSENKIMGFIAADFSYEVISDKVRLQEIKEKMWSLASIIKPVLDYSDYQNINTDN